MPPPALAPLAYEAWILRRTSATDLRVHLAVVASGLGDVLVPLPWPEARRLDETPQWGAFWEIEAAALRLQPRVYPVALGSQKQPMYPRWGSMAPELPAAEPEELRGDGAVRLLSRAEVPSQLAATMSSSWDFAQRFLWWPSRPAPRGLAAWFSRRKARKLVPVTLSVERAAPPFRTQPARLELTVATTANVSDVYVIDSEELVAKPWGAFNLVHWTSMPLPGLVEHFHWLRDQSGSPPKADHSTFQRSRDAAIDWLAEIEANRPPTEEP